MTNGQKVRTAVKLGTITGMLIAPKHLNARQADSLGVIRGWVPGHGGDVWWVEHSDDSVGAYSLTEFSKIP